jgi:hypothetical protein
MMENTWPEVTADRLEELDWDRARSDVLPFLQRQEDLRLIDLQAIRKLLLRR